jgi:hypothetical protein
MSDSFVLELGDAIGIKYMDTSEHIYVITYIDADNLILHDIDDISEKYVPIVNLHIDDINIAAISLIYRNSVKGYALQNGLSVGLGVNIQFSDQAYPIRGEITHMYNDAITVVLDNTFETIYIDFKYQGIPIDANKRPLITYITPFKYSSTDRPKDRIVKLITTNILPNLQVKDGIINVPNIVNAIIRKYPKLLTPDMSEFITTVTIEYFKTLDNQYQEPSTSTHNIKSTLDVPSSVHASKYQLQLAINDADTLIKEDETEAYMAVSEQNYDIDEQVNEMLNEFLSTIPDNNRTPMVMKGLQRMLHRYRQLYSLYILSKPQATIEDNLSMQGLYPSWVIPVVAQNLNDVNIASQLSKLQSTYNTNSDNRYNEYLINIDRIYSSVSLYDPETCSYIRQVPIDKLGISIPSDPMPGEPVKYTITQYTQNDPICQTGLLMFPLYLRYYSTYTLPTSMLYKKVSRPMFILNTTLPHIKINKVLMDIDMGGISTNTKAYTHYVIPKYQNNIISPNTAQLFATMAAAECDIEKYISSYGTGYSIYSLISDLSVYGLYYFNSDEYDYKIVNSVLKKRIHMFDTRLDGMLNVFSKLHKKIHSAKKHEQYNSLCNLFTQSVVDEIFGAYKLPIGAKYTASELISTLKSIDGGTFYIMNIMLAYITSKTDYSYSPISPYGEDVDIDNVPLSLLTSKPDTDECKHVKVVAKYISMEDLMNDNHKELTINDVKVSDSDYALLLENSNTIAYYVRHRNKWVKDTSVIDTFVLDSPHMFCNLKLKCIPNHSTKHCVNLVDFASYLINQLNADIAYNIKSIKPFDISSIQEMFDRYYTKLQNLMTISHLARIKQTLYHYKLGTTIDKLDVVISPYFQEFIEIIGEEAIKSKYSQLLEFCQKYTRPNNIENNIETPHWRYCTLTQVPLVPNSLYEIAYLYNMYSSDINEFNVQVELLKQRVGVLGDDGDSVVDKYTGYKLSDIEFDNSEEYDDAGFVAKTRAVIEADVDETKQQIITNLQNERDYALIRYVVKLITEKMGIDGIPLIPFITQKVQLYLPQKMTSSIDRTIWVMIYTISMLSISLQINIPDLKPTVSVPGCVNSLSGYPVLGDKSDMALITYLICIVQSIPSKSEPLKEPWKSFAKYTDVSVISPILISIIDTYFMTDVDIISKIEYKKRYITYHSVYDGAEHSVNSWDNYVPFKNISLVSKGFVNADLSISKISDNPTKYMPITIEGALYYISAVLQYYIYNITVRNFKGDKKGTTYRRAVVNACCYTPLTMTLMEYITSEEPRIIAQLENAKRVVYAYSTVAKLLKGMTVRFHQSSYNTIIHPLRYTVYPSTIQAFFDKHTAYKSSTAQKETGDMYTNEEFERLLYSIYGNTLYKIDDISTLVTSKILTPDNIKTYLNTYKATVDASIMLSRHIILPADVINEFDGVLSKYVDVNIEPPVLSKFRTYLQSRISSMYKIISDAFSLVKTSVPWMSRLNPKHPSYMFYNFSTSYRSIKVCLEWVKTAACIFPSRIIHNINRYQGTVFMDLSSQHMIDIDAILSAKYTATMGLHNDQLIELFKTILPTLIMFTDVVYTTVTFAQQHMDVDTTVLLIKYYIHVLISFLIQSASDVNVDKYAPKTLPNIIIKYITTVFDLCISEVTQLDRKLKTLADDNLQIRNIEKNNLLKEFENMTKEEQSMNKLLKQLKLNRWAAPEDLHHYTKAGYDKGEQIQYDAPLVDADIPDDMDMYDNPNQAYSENVGENVDVYDDDYEGKDGWEMDADYIDQNELEDGGDNY